jgi:hypothetical protein
MSDANPLDQFDQRAAAHHQLHGLSEASADPQRALSRSVEKHDRPNQ